MGHETITSPIISVPPVSLSSSFFICCVYFHCKMELSSKSLWLRIVCPNISHTSVSWILICLEHCTLKSKADGRSGGEGDKGNREIENRKHGIKWKQCTLLPVFLFIYLFIIVLYITVFPLSAPFSLCLPWSFLGRALAATREIGE